MEETAMSATQLRSQLGKLFDSAKTLTAQQSLVEAAKKLYNKQKDETIFLREFITTLKYALIYPDKNAADKMLTFVAKFAASLYSYAALIHDSEEIEEEMESPFVNGLFFFLFETHTATLVDVRLRCTTLINYTLTALPEDSWLPVSIWNGLAEMTRCRLQDRNANVRVAAVLVARKLQEPKDPKCEIVKLLTFHMVDPTPAVRRAVISSIALSKFTIKDVIARTLDVNENVRRNAFAVIAKVRFQSLTISQRVTLLDRGLKERSERVRSCVETVMISQWLDQVKKNVLHLMEGIDVVNCPDVAVLALESLSKLLQIEELIKALPLDSETRLIPQEKLTPETALLWRFIAGHLTKNSNEMEELLDSFLPTLSAFTDLIKSWYPSDLQEELADEWLEVKQKQVLIHLLKMAPMFDLSDEMGRMQLKNLTFVMLASPRVGNLLVDNFVDLLHVLIPDSNEFIYNLLEIISEIREPLAQIERPKEETMQLELLVSNLKIQLNDLKEKEYEAAQKKDYIEASKLSDEIKEVVKKIEDSKAQTQTVLSEVREEKTDPVTVCKCLRILVKMMPASGTKELTPGLRTLQEEFLSKCLDSQDLLTQSFAIQALAQFCILDKNLAQDKLLGFLSMLSENGDNEINSPALKAVFDILQTHGTQCFEKIAGNAETESEQMDQDVDDIDLIQSGSMRLAKPTAKCIVVLKELLNCTNNDELKKTAFEGFCKLLLTGVVYSPSLLKSVIIKGFTPIRGNECEDRIRQLFMVFFSLFARNTRRSQEMIEAAFIFVLRSLYEAPLGSPEADINPRDVAAFLIDHTKPGINANSNKNLIVHNALALSLCLEILRDISEKDLAPEENYLRALLQLQITLDDASFVQQLFTLLLKIKRVTKDAASLRMINQMQLKINQRSSSIVTSVENTIESTRTTNTEQGDSRTSRLTNSTFHKTSLENVPESLEDLTIVETSTSSECVPPQKNDVIAESPEMSEASDS